MGAGTRRGYAGYGAKAVVTFAPGLKVGLLALLEALPEPIRGLW